MPFVFWPMIDEVEFPIKGHIRIRVVFYRFNFFPQHFPNSPRIIHQLQKAIEFGTLLWEVMLVDVVVQTPDFVSSSFSIGHVQRGDVVGNEGTSI